MATRQNQPEIEAQPPGLCVQLDVRGVPILIVGGGAVAARRGRLLLDAGADCVTAVAPRFDETFPETITQVRGVFHADQLENTRLVFVATNDPVVNEQVGAACAERGIWCNRSDQAEAGDVRVPLSWNQGPVQVTLSTGSPRLTQALARQLRATIEPWVEPARVAGRLREAVRTLPLPPEARRALLADIATDEARSVLEEEGEPGLYRWLAARHPAMASLPAENRDGSPQR